MAFRWREKKMVLTVIVVLAVICMMGIIAGGFLFVDENLAPLFLNSRIERIHESGLPKAVAQKGGVYCRMKADDFWFPLPPGSSVKGPIVVTGGFDTVDGSLEVIFEPGHPMSSLQYQSWVSGKVQVGGNITAEPEPSGLLIKFDYFGDR